MKCANCGAELIPDQRVCPACGQTVAPLETPPPTSRKWLAPALLLSIALLIALLAAAWLAVREGETLRAARERAAAALFVDRADVLLQAGETEQAERELNEALRLAPDYSEAHDRLTRLRQSASSTTAGPGGATTGQRVGATTPEDVLAQAQRAGVAGDWAGAATHLETLRQTAPDYEPGMVTTLLKRSYMADGRQRLEQGQVEAALMRYEAVLRLAPDDLDAIEQRDLAQLYLDALENWDKDWAIVIEKLDALYQRAPDYVDVGERLAAAYLKQGEEQLAQQPCQAQETLTRAVALADQPDTRALLDRASQACQAARPPAADVSARQLTPRILDTQAADGARGHISGRVLDRQRRPLAGVEVTAQGAGARFWFAITDRQGAYQFESLPPAEYTLDIPEAIGPSIRIPLEAGQRILVDFTEQ